MKGSLRGLLLSLAITATGGAQAISDLPQPAAGKAKTDWVLEHLEAPGEIALGTIAVNVWVRLEARGDAAPLRQATLVLEETGERVPMIRVSEVTPEFVATLDTYAWVEDAAHAFRIEVRAEDGEAVVARGTVRVKPRVAAADLVVFDGNGFAHAWIGSGAGGFTPSSQLDAGVAALRPTVVDYDADGFDDVLLINDADFLQVMRNTGNGRFELASSHSLGPIIHAAVGDVDGDGKPDVVTLTADRMLEIRPGLDAGRPLTYPLSLAPEYVALADFEGDGVQEIVVGLLGFAETEIEVWGRVLVEEGLEAIWERREVLPAPEVGRGRLVTIGVERGVGDGARDAIHVLCRGEDQGTLESWRIPADTESGSRSRAFTLPGEPIGVVSGRFSLGEITSLVLVEEEEGAAIFEFPPQGTPRRRGTVDQVPEVLAAVDLDGDEDDDLVTGGSDLRLWINVQGGEFREAGESPYLLEFPAVALTAGSLDERQEP